MEEPKNRKQEMKTTINTMLALIRRFPRLGSLVEWTPRRVRERPLPTLDLNHQLAAIHAIVFPMVFALSSLGSPTATKASPSLESGAASVSPLSIISDAPVAQQAPAALPPLISDGDTVSVTLAAIDTTVEIAGGLQYQAWTFGGTVPGPILHVRQGQTVNVTFVNKGHLRHSIDFHAAQIDPSVAYHSVNPGEKIEFSFVAETPGAFVYHCGTPPVLLHMANGMYGAII